VLGFLRLGLEQFGGQALSHTIELLLYTGQRGSNVYRITWGDIDGDTIWVAQAQDCREAQRSRSGISPPSSRHAKSRIWHQSLAEQSARIRRPGNEQRHRKSDGSPEAIPRRHATANRVLTILKAALNHAWKVGQVVSDDAWRRTKPFKGVDTARVRYLTEAECVRVLIAANADNSRMG